jgi:hypothetical protein
MLPQNIIPVNKLTRIIYSLIHYNKNLNNYKKEFMIKELCEHNIDVENYNYKMENKIQKLELEIALLKITPTEKKNER